MQLTKWIREILFHRDEKALKRAGRLADDVAQSARQVNEQLEPFTKERDPLLALMMDLRHKRKTDSFYDRLHRQ